MTSFKLGARPIGFAGLSDISAATASSASNIVSKIWLTTVLKADSGIVESVVSDWTLSYESSEIALALQNSHIYELPPTLESETDYAAYVRVHVNMLAYSSGNNNYDAQRGIMLLQNDVIKSWISIPPTVNGQISFVTAHLDDVLKCGPGDYLGISFFVDDNASGMSIVASNTSTSLNITGLDDPVQNGVTYATFEIVSMHTPEGDAPVVPPV